MDPVRAGLALRAVRRRLGWRQADVARRAGISQQTVSDIERGLAGRVGMRQLLHVAAALGAELDLIVRWRGGAIDRLLDERHASLCSAVARRLTRSGWEVIVEAAAWAELANAARPVRGIVFLSPTASTGGNRIGACRIRRRAA